MAKAEKSVSKKSSESKRQEAIGEDGRTRYSKDAERTLLREGDPVSRRELRDDPGSETSASRVHQEARLAAAEEVDEAAGSEEAGEVVVDEAGRDRSLVASRRKGPEKSGPFLFCRVRPAESRQAKSRPIRTSLILQKSYSVLCVESNPSNAAVLSPGCSRTP